MPSDRPPLTQARLKELLHYDPETGYFTRLVSRNSSNAVAGSRAGSVDCRGYRVIQIDRRTYKEHRLAFVYMTGSFPPAEVDHINRDRVDNRWSNLRPATSQENHGNTGRRADNTSGHRGVTWDKRHQKWHAQGMCGGRRIHLGRYSDLEEAAAAAQAWREQHFGPFASAGHPDIPQVVS